MVEKEKNTKLISITEAAKSTPYSAEYLSLLARKGKLKAQKIGRNWYITPSAIRDYLSKQIASSIVNLSKNGVLVPPVAHTKEKNFLHRQNNEPQFEIRSASFGTDSIRNQRIAYGEDFLNTVAKSDQDNFAEALSDGTGKEEALRIIRRLPAALAEQSLRKKALRFADREQSSQKLFSEPEKDYLDKRVGDIFEKFITKFIQFLDVTIQSHFGLTHRIIYFFRKSSRDIFRSLRNTTIAFFVIFIFVALPLEVVLGQFDNAFYYAYQKVKDAGTLMGHTAGINANQVLLLDKDGNISIIGHIATEGQLRSSMKDGVAPIVVDSRTLVKNLNAEYLNGIQSKDFTLAFVTKNGNVTYENVRLEGSVEVGKTLIVRGATHLLDSLTVDGDVGLLSNLLVKGGLDVRGVTNLSTLVADFIVANRMFGKSINGDSVSGSAIDATETLKAKNVTVTGQSVFDGYATHHSGITAKSGTFEIALETGGDFGAGGNIRLGASDKNASIVSKQWSIDKNGKAIFATTTVTTLQASSNATSSVNSLAIGDTAAYLGNSAICTSGNSACNGVLSSAGGWTDDGIVVRLTTSTDFVGIGTTSPASTLNVTASDAINNGSTTILTIDHALANSGSAQAQANIGSSILFRAFNTASSTQNSASITGFLSNVTPGSEAGQLAFYTRTGGGGLQERMKIDNTGNVIIPNLTATGTTLNL
ncbi:hypothetical protein KGQ34_04320, partial [Patescibacteria group bacterium]|nr:hypothetical protein [Patescibacteria group bacterium]